ncbi:MAG: NYN domain-containing protein [Gemmatimonadetes bacterium]|nr:NYN domain-containing protein [Candidatus Palauibacter rhopaloidicola]
MNGEPRIKRTVAFVDGQNLFHAAREAFGYTYANYDVSALAGEVCARQGWELSEVRFYTGIPAAHDEPKHGIWTRKLAAMRRQGVVVYSRRLRYRNRQVTLPDGTRQSFPIRVEKGIDVRIALDVIGQAHGREYDVALIMSQDQDFSEVAREIRRIGRAQRRWIKIASAFPDSPTSRNRRGINRTDWIRIDRSCYDRCLDPRDYRK